jgi:hypothetical protein
MGRPPKAAEDKRQQITLRFDPAVMEKLKASAEASGRSLGKEVEERAGATLHFDEVGLELVRRIGAGIVALQRLHGGVHRHKPWHVDLSCWASIAELLAEGPIFDMRPLNPTDEDAMWEACLPVFEIDRQREELVRKLAELGIDVAVERKVRGLLKLDSRVQERASIDAIPESDLKIMAVSHHEALRKLDDEHDAALLACRDAMDPYMAAEEAGRQICRDYLQAEAHRKRAAGQRVNPFHLIRQFPVWL